MSVAAAAAYVGVCRVTIYGLINRGTLPARKIGTRTILLRDDVDRYIEGLPAITTRGGGAG